MAARSATGDASSIQLSVNGASCTILKNCTHTFLLGAEQFRITTEGFFIPDLQLWAGDTLLASARKETFSYAGGVWKFKNTKSWSEIEYSLFQNKDRVGTIRSTRRALSVLFGLSGLDFREIVIDLPEEFPGAVLVFLTWVACYRWTRIDGVSSD